ncbi:MAG TPA: ABC transporter permease [Fimbriimonadaceae bacterium]|nr:ABC transporter permease [Fimbriimonadaceae bacterium]
MKRLPLVPLVLLVIAVFVAARYVPHFFDARYLLDTSTLYIEVGLLALGSTLVIVTGNIDLSVGSNLVLSACLTAMLMRSGYGTFAAVTFSCVVGTVLGAINGLMVAKLRLPSFLVTLGTMAAYRGAAQAAMGAKSIALPDGFKGIDQSLVFGVPWPLVIFLAIAVVSGVLLHRTVFGRWAFALGTNESASQYSGLPNDWTKIAVFAYTGLMAGIGALLMDSRLAVARHDLARGIELDAITVAVVGGAAITGGKGSILGTAIALFLLMTVRTAMGVANVKAEYQLTAIGALLVVTVLASEFRRKSAADE